MKIKRICKQCGKRFETYPCYIKRGSGKFCSHKCAAKARGRKLYQICPQCNKRFKIYPYMMKQGWGKFCSRKCYNKAHIKVKYICKQCGKEFKRHPSKIKLNGDNFCSRKCKDKWQSENYKGENNPNWKGGLSFLPYCHKFNEEFKEYIRDKFGRVCFLCPKTEEENEERLSVHHCNYDKDCLCNDNLTCQFVPLCRSCNIKVNYNRDMWEAKIKAKMQNKLNGWYI